MYCFLASIISIKTLAIRFSVFSMKIMCYFFWLLLGFFFYYFISFTKLCLGLFVLVFNILWVHWAWFCYQIDVVHQFWKILGHYIFKTCFWPVFSFRWFYLHACEIPSEGEHFSHCHCFPCLSPSVFLSFLQFECCLFTCLQVQQSCLFYLLACCSPIHWVS